MILLASIIGLFIITVAILLGTCKCESEYIGPQRIYLPPKNREVIIIMNNQEQRTKRHQEICTELNNLYDMKNKKYGNSFSKTYEEYGAAMLCIRLDDKLGRAKQLLLHGQEGTDDESVIDTLKDMANYAIMGIMELEKEDKKNEV